MPLVQLMGGAAGVPGRLGKLHNISLTHRREGSSRSPPAGAGWGRGAGAADLPCGSIQGAGAEVEVECHALAIQSWTVGKPVCVT